MFHYGYEMRDEIAVVFSGKKGVVGYLDSLRIKPRLVLFSITSGLLGVATLDTAPGPGQARPRGSLHP